MRVLIVGSGGREHALAWKIKQSPLVSALYCAPGNAGIAQIAECPDLRADDVHGLADFAEAKGIALTVVGPEVPLIAGIVDVFESRGLPIVGPSADPARIEGSKIFSKQLMQSSGIPTADFWVCDSLATARERVREYYALRGAEAKIVVKADGLAAGKGVVVASSEAEALQALDRMMGARVFGASGDRVVLEECLVGEEASIMAITDGETVLPLLPSQDHKRAYDGDAGPNTGGMGAYCPVPILPTGVAAFALERILQPAIAAIKQLGIPYKGILYAGVIVTADGPKCIEFNCRLGDPETQAVLPLLESDLVPILLSVTDSTLDQHSLHWRAGSAVCVVAASGGYPEQFDPGMNTAPLLSKPITGLDAAANTPDCLVFHAGTRYEAEQAAVVTSGGRVLSVTGLGKDLRAATAAAYAGLHALHFDAMHYRRDIAARSLH